MEHTSQSLAGGETDRNDDLAAEQRYVSMLYKRLDTLREETSRWLREALHRNAGTPQALTERDVATKTRTERLAQLSAVENGLCFGRLEFDGGERSYIGRIGLFDEDNGYEPLLMDWRAPAARPFYLATAANRDGVQRRRRIRTKRRTVVDIDDEVLDLEQARGGSGDGLAGEAALLAALNASRTGQMQDIVATIQAEQDRIIRSGRNGVLVVQGAPGTGKTAVALHRAAYLLYTHREQLARRGVLVVGPNTTFLRYIGQVLPSLGETGVLLSTPGELFPDISAHRHDDPAVAEIKGRPEMATVIRAAVRDRQRVPKDEIVLTFEQEPLRITKQICTQARTKARRSKQAHNQAKKIFEREVIAGLAEQVADRLGASLLDQSDISDIRAELHDYAPVREQLDELWPLLSPQQLLDELLSSPRRLRAAGRKLGKGDKEKLAREPGAEWTVSDVPLLDEAAELLGEDDTETKAREERKRQEELAYAQGVLDILDLQDDADPEVLMANDLLDARVLAERQRSDDGLTAAERAAQDRTWTFGHVIVDEAQELSAMDWRVVMRRCPSRSMTVVGDVAQTGHRGGASSWHEVLSPYVANRWRLEQLTVNYRTPAEIMAVATDVLAAIDPALEGPSSVRDTGVRPWTEHVSGPELQRRLAELVTTELERVGDGTLGVLLPAGLRDQLGEPVAAAVPHARLGAGEDGLDSAAALLTVEQAKGLEFDGVLVVDPAGIVAESPRGYNDLYVALTRATQRLGVVSLGELPGVLGRLRTDRG